VAGLVWPTTVYVGAVAVSVVVLDVLGTDRRTLSVAAWLVALHLWFLSVYLVLLLLTPLQVALHRRWGLAVPVALAVGAALADLASLGWSVDPVGWASYLLVWGCVHQVGVAWHDGALARHRAVPIVVAGAGLAVLVALVGWGPYPLSMVGVPGAQIQNTSPPTVALLAFAGVQTGVLLALEPLVSRRLEDPGRWARVSAANRLAIVVYLWHMVPVVAVAVTLYPAGVMPQPEAGSVVWWLSRVLWVSALAAVLGLVVRAILPLLPWLRRLPSCVGRPRRSAALLVPVGVAALAAALARLAVDGFYPDGRPPWATLALYAAGFALVLLGTAVLRPGPALPRAGRC
jgi:hypothetical protein